MKVFKRTENIVSRKIAGELFLVPISGDLADMQRMFALTEVAQFIWERFDGQKSLGDICNEIVTQFEIEKEQADADASEFLAELIAEGLVREVAV